jgi:hypothetical protein
LLLRLSLPNAADYLTAEILSEGIPQIFN